MYRALSKQERNIFRRVVSGETFSSIGPGSAHIFYKACKKIRSGKWSIRGEKDSLWECDLKELRANKDDAILLIDRHHMAIEAAHDAYIETWIKYDKDIMLLTNKIYAPLYGDDDEDGV